MHKTLEKCAVLKKEKEITIYAREIFKANDI